MAHNAIELIGINKSFGPVQANRDINLAVEQGTIHGIIGENGAGKSTLMSILYGFYQADSGQIKIGGQQTTINTPNDAIAKGIGMVHQHFMLVENFTVLENVMLGAEILILDEPTGVLTPAEADHLFRILKQLKEQGKTIVLITHKLREIMAVTDNVSVMRQGAMVATRKTAETSVEELAELMVGRRVLLRVEKGEAKPGEVKLAVENLTVRDSRGVTMVNNVSFEVRAGEIVGIAGVAGNGQSQMIEAIAGIRRAETGRVLLEGKPIGVTGEADPFMLRKRGMAHVPEDRHHMGLVLQFEQNENSILGYHGDEEYVNGPMLDIDGIRSDANTKIEKYDIRPPNCRLRTANFSGGNQQKIVLAREMEQDPSVLIVGQPTRGVDVGAIEFIHKRIIEMRDQGKAVLLVSVELDEIRSLADRILVMFAGRVVGERSPETTEGELGLLMAGVEGDPTKEAAE